MTTLDKKLPDKPGVYFFKKGNGILYIGKATSLQSRVKSYFSDDIILKRSALIGKMISEATSVEYKATDSVLEALIFEASLIKKHQPYYNVREKDDRSWNYVVITKEVWPRVLIVRGKLLDRIKNEELGIKINPIIHDSKFIIPEFNAGPFPHGAELREALKIVRKIFPFRDKCLPAEDSVKAGVPENGKPCFNAQIGLCPGVCSSAITRKDYLKIVRNIQLLFEGKKSKIVSGFKRDMKNAVKTQDFEKAATFRNKIFALIHINDIALLKRKLSDKSLGPGISQLRIEAYDIAHISGISTVGAMTVLLGGEIEKNEYRKFKLKGSSANKVNDIANLYEVLTRRFTNTDWPKPDLIVVDGSHPQKNVTEKVLGQFHLKIPIVAVVKNAKHKPEAIIGDFRIVHDYHNEILLANGEAHRFALSYHRKVRSKMVK